MEGTADPSEKAGARAELKLEDLACIHLTSEELIAQAISPPGLVKGRPIAGEVETKHSAKDCANALFSILEQYNFHPRLHTSKAPLDKIHKMEGYKSFAKGHSAWDPRRVNYVYCKLCYDNDPDPEKWRCSVIAIYASGFEGEGSTRCATAKLLAVYPHCSQCNVPYRQRRNVIMDRENHGRGWEILVMNSRISFLTSSPISPWCPP
jgi:hypothetical protein